MDEFDNIFGNDELDEILKHHKALIKETFIDLNKKEIGDRVMILDYMSMTYENGKELNLDDYEFINMNAYYIIIATYQRRTTTNPYGTYLQDLKIANPKTNKIFRIASKHVKLK
jgi:hypothetical protein